MACSPVEPQMRDGMVAGLGEQRPGLSIPATIRVPTGAAPSAAMRAQRCLANCWCGPIISR
jgi:hypothetical protein